MARPQKQTVDFFPHYCKQYGKTIYILEQRFGNNGYTFWFKLLEELGNHNGHCIDFTDENELEFFGAKIRVSVSETLEMLDLAAKLKAIDPILWGKKIVWCQNFVNNLSEVYAKRVVSAPEKPVSAPEKPVSDSDNPQSRVEESRVKESKINTADKSAEEFPLKEKKESPKMTETNFETFWGLYPRHAGVSKKLAYKNFMKLSPDKLPIILEAVKKQILMEQWQNPKFIPHPATWLNQERWEDQVEQANINANERIL